MQVWIHRHTSRDVTIHWDPPTKLDSFHIVTCIKIANAKDSNNKHHFHLYGSSTKKRLSDGLKPGCLYNVRVKYKHLYDDQLQIEKGSSSFCTVMTLHEQQILYKRAQTFSAHGQFRKCSWFYRNKIPAYYNKIFKKHDGIMEVYMKDFNGDPASVINGRLPGLFFGVNVDLRTGEPPDRSPFGSRRLSVPADEMMGDEDMNMYFVDFYCNYKVHYVTLVLTHQGSEADEFCQNNTLRPVNINNNKFLYRTKEGGMTHVWVATGILVEVFYTEDIDINKLLKNSNTYLSDVASTGTSTKGGLPKNSNCNTCNLY